MTSAQETIHCFPQTRSFDTIKIYNSVSFLWLLNVITRGYILISLWENTHRVTFQVRKFSCHLKTTLQPYEMKVTGLGLVQKYRKEMQRIRLLNDKLKWGRGLLQRHFSALERSQVSRSVRMSLLPVQQLLAFLQILNPGAGITLLSASCKSWQGVATFLELRDYHLESSVSSIHHFDNSSFLALFCFFIDWINHSGLQKKKLITNLFIRLQECKKHRASLRQSTTDGAKKHSTEIHFLNQIKLQNMRRPLYPRGEGWDMHPEKVSHVSLGRKYVHSIINK